MGSGFRVFNKFAVFLYSQPQNVLPDQTLGSILDWDSYLCLDLDRIDLPFQTASEFVLNVHYHNLVIAVLELMSHYPSGGHLEKEHRIRMEIPGMPLFDREEQELQGVPLSEAIRKAIDTYPKAPQLDPCRPLVNQASVPDLGSHTNPYEEVLSQICILEFGSRFGGHLGSLTGVHNELVRHLPSVQQTATFNWSENRIFVSIFFIILIWVNVFDQLSLLVTGSSIEASKFNLFPGDLGVDIPRTVELLCDCNLILWSLFAYSST